MTERAEMFEGGTQEEAPVSSQVAFYIEKLAETVGNDERAGEVMKQILKYLEYAIPNAKDVEDVAGIESLIDACEGRPENLKRGMKRNLEEARKMNAEARERISENK